MAVSFDLVCTDRRLALPQRRENTLRALAEIMPYVLAKYRLRSQTLPAPVQRPNLRSRYEA